MINGYNQIYNTYNYQASDFAISELLIWNRKLSLQEVVQVEKYLNSKYVEQPYSINDLTNEYFTNPINIANIGTSNLSFLNKGFGPGKSLAFSFGADGVPTSNTYILFCGYQNSEHNITP